MVYNRLPTHFEQSQARLRYKKVPWKKGMLNALKAGSQKLSVYYKSTEEAHGCLYAMGTILAPQYKLKFFEGLDWSGEVEFDNTLSSWYDIYETSLHGHLEDYSKRQPERQIPTTKFTVHETEDEMASLLAEDQPPLPPPLKATGWQEELKEYLNLSRFILCLLLVSDTDFLKNGAQQIHAISGGRMRVNFRHSLHLHGMSSRSLPRAQVLSVSLALLAISAITDEAR